MQAEAVCDEGCATAKPVASKEEAGLARIN